MRIKDDKKRDAIIRATVKLVNEIGFASSSVSKIAKEADVSPATIYIYYENKEDLIVSTYVELKKGMSEAMLEDFDDSLPIRDILQKVWKTSFDYISNNLEYFRFAEQFGNSPYMDLLDTNEIDSYFEPIIKVLQRGIEQKIIKDVHFELLATFIFYPIMNISNSRICKDIIIDDETIDVAFSLAWDAIKF